MNLSVSKEQRIKSIDVLRGFAILGIFLVNIPTMLGMELFLEERSYNGFDAYLRLFYDLFVQTKFYVIFSFLFGLGFWIFMSRAEQRGAKMYRLFSQRLVILLLFALIHISFFWNGDILNTYAFTGFWLLLFYKRNPKTILIWSIVLLVLSELITILGSLVETTESVDSIVPAFNQFDGWLEQAYARIQFFLIYGIPANIVYFPEILGLFLLGLFVGKIELFQRINELRKNIRTIQIIAFLLTIPSWIMLFVQFTPTSYNPSENYVYVVTSGKTLSIFYVTSLLLLLEKERWQTFLAPVGYVGRMALTNYLGQTVVTTTLFALLFDNTAEITLWQSAIYCLAFYALQMFLSKWWLSQFQFGPLEWLWRMGTYGRVQPL
ncbi:DUF418 domain-containing protein [Niallia sp. 03190]|uniref:DUF418 domain-containing protein n=1 Tax=Niallia sp. 03190 TaxID=3458061 RepID=UPI004043BF35